MFNLLRNKSSYFDLQYHKDKVSKISLNKMRDFYVEASLEKFSLHIYLIHFCVIQGVIF